MHELTIAGALLRNLIEAAQAEDATAILSATVRVGALSHVQHDALRFGFEALSRDTLAAGCALELEVVPADGECAACGWTGPVTDPILFPCPACGHLPVRTTGGRELVLASASLETP